MVLKKSQTVHMRNKLSRWDLFSYGNAKQPTVSNKSRQQVAVLNKI